MIAGEQDLRNWASHELPGPRVLRVLEKTLGKRLLPRRCFVAQHAREESGCGLQDDHRREFPPSENVVTDREFFVHRQDAHTFIHALILAADQDQTGKSTEFPGCLLIEQPSLRAQQDDPCPRTIPSLNRLQASNKRFGLHDHPAASPVRRVVRHSMLVRGKIPNVVTSHPDLVLGNRPAEDTGGQVRIKHLREEGEDFKDHLRSTVPRSCG